MGTQQEHIDQAKHNKALLDAIPENAYDWRITIMMYACLHGIQAYFRLKEVQSSTDHYGSYSTELQKLGQGEMAADFLQLVKGSQQARYHCRPLTELQRRFPADERRFQAIMSKLFALGIRT